MKRGQFFKTLLVAFAFYYGERPASAGATSKNSALHSDEQLLFKVGRKPLAEALLLFARQAGISIARPPFSDSAGKSRAVVGKYKLEDGLRRLLSGTKYSFLRLSDTSVRIVKLPATEKLASADAAPEDMKPTLMPEILVSATRRNGYIQNLPYSITAVSGSQLTDLGRKSTQDITQFVAGIYTTGEGTGRNKVIMRGLSDGPFSGRVQSLVSTYQDYSRVAYNAPDPGLALYDVERIEILRGPQGTLYGSGALGGLYRIVNREPALENSEFSVGSRVGFTRAGDPTSEISTVVNLLAIPNKLALRALAYHQIKGGYIDDTRLNIENINRNTTTGARLVAKLKPSDTWHAIFSVGYQQLDTDDGNYFNGALDTLERDNYLSEPHKDGFLNVTGTIHANLSWGNIVSATSWIGRNIDSLTDASTAVPILTGLNIRPSPFKIDRDISTITNETHVSSKAEGNFNWLFGLFLSHRSESILSNLEVPGAAQDSILGATDQIYSEKLKEKLNEFAVFGEFTHNLSQRLYVTFGGRLFYYEADAVSDLDDIGAIAPLRVTGQQRKTGFTPKLLSAYQYADNGLLYFQVSEGYRLGGVNLAGLTPIEEIEVTGGPAFPPINAENPILANFESDRLRNYELGMKNSFFGKKLTLNSAFFYATWKKIQSYEYGFNGLPQVANIGDARLFGFEAEVLYQPSACFSLDANVSWNDSKITATNGNFGAETGSALPGAPNFSAAITVRKSFQLLGYNATITGDHAYVGGAQLLFNRHGSPRMEPYHLTNFRISFFSDRWQFTAFVNNLVDTKANVFPYGNPFALNASQFDIIGEPGETFATNGALTNVAKQHTPPRPRTAGLTATLHF